MSVKLTNGLDTIRPEFPKGACEINIGSFQAKDGSDTVQQAVVNGKKDLDEERTI